MMKVFKFGGASVKDSAAVRNMARIVGSYAQHPLVVVVSAMGKTTNAIERIHAVRFNGESYEEEFNEVERYHTQLTDELFGDNPSGRSALQKQLDAFLRALSLPCSSHFDQEYDALIGYGELLSTAIIAAFLQKEGITSQWMDARELIVTDNRFRDARVNWEESALRMNSVKQALSENHVCVLQGFIGSTLDGRSTSLGREGSDFTAAIMAYLLDATDVTIWKDVPGMLNADPKKFSDTVKLDRISFKEAIELAYYGASIIHPKTIKPLQNKGIPLHIKSFVDPNASGSIIQEGGESDQLVPSYIVKDNQTLFSISTRDFSFIVEDNLKEIFGTLSVLGIRVHLMENSAISFSIVFDTDKHKQQLLIEQLQARYSVKFNEELTLLTIRHGNDESLKKLKKPGQTLIEQRTRHTMRMVIKPQKTQ
jgi:aspartate kinase